MIIQTYDWENERINFSTLLVIDDRYIVLKYSRMLGYINPEKWKNPTLEKAFFWSFRILTNEEFLDEKGKPKRLNHPAYLQIKESNYNQDGKWHEMRWEEVVLNEHGHFVSLSNGKRSYPVAVPPVKKGETRIDYITCDGKYHYDCKKGQYQNAIEINVK